MAQGSILVTGAAGFIGFHVVRALIAAGRNVIGLDNLNTYYDRKLKEARIAALKSPSNFRFVKLDLADREGVSTLFAEHRFAHVVHLAAQAGVRYSLVDPHAYTDANLVGFTNILEGCRHHGCEHLLYASSSSVYGANTRRPSSIDENVDHPLSFYAATKKANELMAHAYSHLYRLLATGLRFFTVYGPWGRPDMAMYIFTAAITAGQPIRLFNYGRMRRDFTYIDDVVEAVVKLVDHLPIPDPAWSSARPDPATSAAPWRVYNIGNSKPVELQRVVQLIEAEVGCKAIVELMPMQPGDVPETCADINALIKEIGFGPRTPVEDGVRQLVAWYRDYHGR